MEMSKDLRAIETELDAYHRSSDFIIAYKNNQKQALFDLLRVYDCLALTAILGGIAQEKLGLKNSNDITFSIIHDLEDALKIAIHWTYEECVDSNADLSYSLSEADSMRIYCFLQEYASQYSVIVDGFTSYSRGANTGKVEDNRIVFDTVQAYRNAFIADVGERFNQSNDMQGNDILKICSSDEFQINVTELKKSICVDNGTLLFETPKKLKELYAIIGNEQWNKTSNVPQEWEFDHFTLQEYKLCWIELYKMCSLYILAKMKSGLPGFAQEQGLMIIEKEALVMSLTKETGITREHVIAIIDMIVYNPDLTNTDIMYQPLIAFGKKLVIAPTLITQSCPERNLLAIIQKMSDSKYAVEVNGLEKIMCDELAAVLPCDTVIATGKKIGKQYPDVDFAIYDKQTNSIMISEIKWLIAADSTKEVFERQKDIDHGCKQIETIMGYAMQDPIKFAKKLFQIELIDKPEIFCCVISKHDIRSLNPYVPVISMNRISSLYKSKSLYDAFITIRNKEYNSPLPINTKMGHRKLMYAGYEIWVPALEVEKDYED